jgi:hypothetical protein
MSDEPRPNRFAPFNTWLKLTAALRGNHIVVTAEIERSRAGSNRCESPRVFASHIIEAESSPVLPSVPNRERPCRMMPQLCVVLVMSDAPQIEARAGPQA